MRTLRNTRLGLGLGLGLGLVLVLIPSSIPRVRICALYGTLTITLTLTIIKSKTVFYLFLNFVNYDEKINQIVLIISNLTIFIGWNMKK